MDKDNGFQYAFLNKTIYLKKHISDFLGQSISLINVVFQAAKICDWPSSANCKHKVDVDIDETEDSDFSPSHPSTSTEWTYKPESEGQWTPSTPSTTTTTEGEPYESPLSGIDISMLLVQRE